MLTVEECLETLEDISHGRLKLKSDSPLSKIDNWDRDFIRDVAKISREGKPLSTAQASIVQKIAGRYREHLVASGIVDYEVDGLLLQIRYRKEPYQSVEVKREVRWAGNSLLIFRCKKNPPVIEDIKRLKPGHEFSQMVHYPKYIPDHRLWIVEVTCKNVQRVMNVIGRHSFAFDDTVAEFLANVTESEGRPSVATIEDEQLVITVKNDELFNYWLEDLASIEGLNV